MIEFGVPREFPDVARLALAALPECSVIEAPAFVARTRAGRRHALQLVPAKDITVTGSADARRLREADTDAVAIIFAARLGRETRAELANDNNNYLDGHGHARIVLPDAVLLIEEPAMRKQAPARGVETVGHVGIRAVQVLIDADIDEWGTSELAAAADVSVGQVHNLFRVLEATGLLEADGDGPRRRRHLRDRSALLTWLEQHRTTVDPREAQLTGYVAARDPLRVAQKLAARGDERHRLAVTGTAAAALLGHPVTTRVGQSLVRVHAPASTPLELIADQLGIEPTKNAPNVTLIRDAGGVGTVRSANINGVPLAPPSRIYLDMFREGRGDDAAALFRQYVLEGTRNG
ncbi:MAG: transcriptional regulator [Thermoleophilia bacterium]|jgi:hypothetical protein|nr:transcriptional regulator [Thermoleophilia bacterium]